MKKDREKSFILLFIVWPIVITTAWFPNPSAGQTSHPTIARSDNVQRAENRFNEGVQSFAEDRYTEALAAFEESFELNPLPMLLFNIAMCQRALEDYSASIRSFRRYLNEANETVTPDQRTEIHRLILQMQSQVTDLSVRSNVQGVTILADEQEMGTTPMGSPLRLVVGSHTIVARLSGYHDRNEEVLLRLGEPASLHLELEPEQDQLPRDEPGPRRSVARSWWLWTIVGAVIVAGAVTTTVLLWPEDGPAVDWSVPIR